MKNKTYRVRDTENRKIHTWSLSKIVSEINRDRIDFWIPYTKKDWREGWNHFVEGERFVLVESNQ